MTVKFGIPVHTPYARRSGSPGAHTTPRARTWFDLRRGRAIRDLRAAATPRFRSSRSQAELPLHQPPAVGNRAVNRPEDVTRLSYFRVLPRPRTATPRPVALSDPLAADGPDAPTIRGKLLSI